MSEKDAAWIQRSYMKRSRSGHKRSLAKKVTNMPNDTCFLGQFTRRFDSDGHLNLWCHQNLLLIEVRSRSGHKRSNFHINILCIKAHVSDSEVPQDSKYVISFLLRCVELPNIANKKIDAILFAIYIATKAKNRYLLENFACAYSTCRSLTYFSFSELKKKIL